MKAAFLAGLLVLWGWVVEFFNAVGQYAAMAIMFSYLRLVILGDRTPRQAFMTYLMGGLLGTTIGVSLEHLQFNQGTIYLIVSGVVLLSENLLVAFIQLGASLSKDPERFIKFWVGVKKDVENK